jgi:hypothetical protein
MYKNPVGEVVVAVRLEIWAAVVRQMVAAVDYFSSKKAARYQRITRSESARQWRFNPTPPMSHVIPQRSRL